MDKDEAKNAIAKLDYDIANSKVTIAGLEQRKQAIKVEINGITTSKKSRMEHLQKEINETKIEQQKKRKRDARDKEKKSFDGRIDGKKKQIENNDTKIASERKKISELKKIKKAIKLDQTNSKK